MRGKSRLNALLIKFCETHKIPYKVYTADSKPNGRSYNTMIVDELDGRMSNWQDAEDEAAEELSFRSEPARKPMTEEEIYELIKDNDLYCKVSFVCGVQAAEKHHGIGGDDE